jgi:hypothetical protein
MSMCMTKLLLRKAALCSNVAIQGTLEASALLFGVKVLNGDRSISVRCLIKYNILSHFNVLASRNVAGGTHHRLIQHLFMNIFFSFLALDTHSDKVRKLCP